MGCFMNMPRDLRYERFFAIGLSRGGAELQSDANTWLFAPMRLPGEALHAAMGVPRHSHHQ